MNGIVVNKTGKLMAAPPAIPSLIDRRIAHPCGYLFPKYMNSGSCRADGCQPMRNQAVPIKGRPDG